MKAALITGAGGPENIVVREVSRPEPTTNQVLVRVRAVSVKARVLINGASGGVGSFAVQLAVALGAEVSRDNKRTTSGLR